MKSIYSFQSICSELRCSMRLSLPLIAAQLVYALNGFIATIMIAHLGPAALAASALVWGVFVTLILFSAGILNAVNVLVAQSYGANDVNGIQQATGQGLILAVGLAIPMMLMMWVAPIILYWTGQSANVIKLAIPYFHALGWCILPLNLLIVMQGFLIGIGKTRLVFFMSLISEPLEALCFYVLLFGKWGAPKLGLAGIGYGITIPLSGLVIIVGLFLHFSAHTREYTLFANCWKISKKYLLELLRIGLPLGGMFCLEVALFTTMAFMMGRFGEDVLAAHNVAYQCFIFALTIIFGISQGVTVRVGHEVGRNNREALKLATYVNMGIGFGFMLVLVVLYTWLPNYIIGMDIDIHAKKYHMLVHYSTAFLAIAGVLQLTDCFRLIINGALRGLKDTKIPMYISMLAFWGIAFPGAYFLAFVRHWGGVGIWWGLVIGLAILAGVLLIRFNRLVNRLDLVALLKI